MAYTHRMHLDPELEQILIQREDTSGTVVTNNPIVKISLADIDTITGGGVTRTVKLRELVVCVDDGSGGFIRKKAIFLCSETY